jgi:hypothetical protein
MMRIKGYRVFTNGRIGAALLASVFAALLTAAPASAYSVAGGWTATDYATGFPAYPNGDVGPIGLAFDRNANLFVADAAAGALYKVPPGGGTADATKLRGGLGMVTGLAYGLDGKLYMGRREEGDVVQVDESDGSIVRKLVENLPCPTGLATDPISGDMFVSNNFCAGGTIVRVSGGAATPYTTDDADGIAFGPDGTLYASSGNRVLRFNGTNTSSPGSGSVIAEVPHADGIAFAPATSARPAFLLVNRTDGEIDRVGFDGSVEPIVTGASRGDLVTVGPDRMAYAALRDRIIKIGADGSGVLPGVFEPPASPNRFKADVRIKVKAPKRVKRGRRFAIVLSVRNAGPATATDVFILNKLPRGARFVSLKASKGVKCSQKGRFVGCNVKKMKANKLIQIRIVLRAIRGRVYTNSASADANQADPKPRNNIVRSRTVRRG